MVDAARSLASSSSVTPRTRPRVRSLRSLLPPEERNTKHASSHRARPAHAHQVRPRDAGRREEFGAQTTHASHDCVVSRIRRRSRVPPPRGRRRVRAFRGRGAVHGDALRRVGGFRASVRGDQTFASLRRRPRRVGRLRSRPRRRSPGRHGRILREFVGLVTPARGIGRGRSVGKQRRIRKRGRRVRRVERRAPRRRISRRGRFVLVAGPGRGGASVGRVPNVRVQSASVFADARARLDRVSVHAPGGEGAASRSPAISLFRNGVSRVSKGVVSARRRVRIRARRVRVLAPSEQVPHAAV